MDAKTKAGREHAKGVLESMLKAVGFDVHFVDVAASKPSTKRPPGWAAKKMKPKTYGKNTIRHRRRG
jgi:hypothetical protein